MRKIYHALLSLLFFFSIINGLHAQVSGYVFNAGTGGTLVDMSSGTNQVIGTGSDDGVSPVLPIGFTFTFNGVSYTQFSANANGLVRLGGTGVTGAFSNTSTFSGFLTTTNLPEIAPYFDDLATGTNGKVHFKLTGTAPTQRLVIEWIVTIPRATGGAANGVFQAWLDETTNKITFIYGNGVVANSLNGGYTIGIASSVTDYQSVTAATNSSSSSAHNGTQSTAIASGVYYEFFPPPPCVPAGLNGGTAQGPAAAVCAGVSFDLSVTGSSFGTGITYQWEFSTNGGATWNDVPGATGQTLTTSVTTTTQFRRKMTCGGTDAWSAATTVNTTAPIAIPFNETFATYATTFPPTCWSNNNPGFLSGFPPSSFGIGAGSARFNFYSASSGTQLDLGTAVFTAVPASYYLMFDHAYATFSTEVDSLQILYSTDGGATFTRLTSYLGGATGALNTAGATFASFSPTASQWASKIVALPVGTNKILFRGFSAFGNNLFIDNVAVSSCLPPTGLNVTNLLPTSVTLNWTASASAPSGGYDWEVRTSGGPGSGATGLAASGTVAAGITTANVTGLTGNTSYTYYLRSNCGGGDLSIWTAGNFITPCDPIAVPFVEAFPTATTSFPPVCWTRSNAFVIGQAVSASGIGVGSARFDFYNATAGTSMDLVTPIFTPVTGYYVIFDHAYATFTTEVDSLQIWYSTNQGISYSRLTSFLGGPTGALNTAGATLPSFTPTATQWATKFVALPAGTNRLIFRGISSFGNNLYVDNIAISSCLPPTALNVTNLLPTTVTLNWTASASAPTGGYEWEVRTSGAPGSGATGLAASGTVGAGVVSANVTGLTGNTNYSYYVRANCGGGDFSIWVPGTFLTPCDPTTAPFVETFSTYATTFPPTCWTRNSTFLTGQAPSAAGIGTGSARFDFYNAAAGTSMDLVSPIFNAVTGYYVVFDHAYATFAGEVDSLQILYSTNQGISYTRLTTYLGGISGPLNTAGGVLPAFAPNSAQWASKFAALPAGTNRILFRGFSSFGNNLFLDNIAITNCLPPTNLNVTNLLPTTVTLNWTASSSNPSGGYEWEVRTSGAPGSGATGLAASGTVAAGVTTVNVTGLAPNTNFTYYVRSSCGGSDFSIWVPGTFLTPCSPIAIPWVENFSTYATTFPPTCWTRSNTFMIGQAASAFGIGTGSARFDFYNATAGTNIDLVTPIFAPVTASYFLVFDHAYATFINEVDQLQIFYSTDMGLTYTSLTTYAGGTNGPLNTAGAVLPSFTPTAGQWATKIIPLPSGTNRIRFRGISAFGNNLYIDNVIISSCLPPTGLGLNAISPTSAGLTWTASASNPGGGYQWEVRTSGAPGSGATGLAASGTTAAGVTTATANALTPFTTYTYYVRSDCGGGDFSIWSSYTFTTPCNPIATPFSENFATYSTTFPPNCWLRNNATFLTGQPSSAYGVGLGSARFDFYNSASGTQLDLVSPLFNATPAGYGLVFDHAYATFAGEVDSLRIMYSTNGGGSYQFLTTYAGGGGGPLNTGGGSLPAFAPNASQWGTKAIALPAGTNRILFKGISAFGNNLFLDNIAVVSCMPPNDVKALGISPTEIALNFTSPGTSFIIEYGAPGFVPGTGAAAGGGTVVTATSSPVILSPLNPNTAYDIYVRTECTAGVDYSVNVKTSATTLCTATGIPYVQTFESAVVPGMPTCTSIQDVNGNSGSFWLGSGAGGWETYTDANPLTYVSPSKALLYYYDFNDLTRPANDWFYTQGLNLTAGTTYRLKFFYKALDGVNFPERLEVKYGTRAYAPDMATTLFTNANITSVYGQPYDSVRVDFTPTATGVYYIGFHAYSNPDEFGILMDDISVTPAPLVDVGISSITLPNLNCPTSGVFIQAKVKNFNTTTIDFATYPVTITGTISGAGTGTVSATLNSGTLAPQETRDVYLNPAFNFTTGGVYNIAVATSSPVDPEIGNDTLKTTVSVNPKPAAPVVTPASASICLGNQVQLSTQFTTPPPAAVTMPPFASGTISVTVPDGVATGTTHSLNVSGIPVGATITSMSVNINMTHTWVNDMVVNLRAPNGRILNLFNRKGAAAADNMTNMTISSASTTPIPTGAGAAPFTGTWAADAATGIGPTAYPSDVANFAGLYSIPNGNWTLAMRDYVGFDVGILTSWSITITYQMLNPVVTWTPVTGLFTNSTATTAYTAGADAPVVFSKPAAAGTYVYTVRATTSYGCADSTNVTVTVNPLPTITIGSIPDTVCISDQVIALDASPVGGTWTGIGVSGTNFIPPATAVGTYTLTYTYTSLAGCTSTATRSIAVKDCPERIVRLADNAVILFPNPNTGKFNIRINSVLYNNLTMSVYTNNGRLVRTQKLTGLTWGRVVPIDISHLPGGVYMVMFSYEGGIRGSEKTFKVMIGTP